MSNAVSQHLWEQAGLINLPLEESVAAFAHRDRRRLAALQGEVSALRHRVAELERSPSRRALAPLRSVVHRVLHLLRPPALPAAAGLLVPCGASTTSRGRALIIDDAWPEPDRDAGSMEIVRLTETLTALGFSVTLAAVRQHDGTNAARDRLVRTGIACVQPEDAVSVAAYLSREGPALDLCVLCRAFCGGALLELAQRVCGKARIVFNSIDLNFLREERKALLLDDPALLALARQVRGREEHIIRSVDATMVVSEAEHALLAETIPEAFAAMLPLARPLAPPQAPFVARRGVGFIGGFAHAPNVDAIRYFLAEIWPLVLRGLPDCRFTIVGPDIPPGLLDGCPGDVAVVGYLPDAGPWFESLVATIAPLRFGAGAKGKVASSLAAGVPCIASPVAVEGMALGPGGGVLVASSPQDFADAICGVCTRPAMWSELSADALAYAESTLSPQAWRTRLDAMLRRIGV